MEPATFCIPCLSCCTGSIPLWFPPNMSRFQSSQHESDLTSLEEYVERMKEKQDHMYFMSAPSRKEAEASPFVERLLKKGYEVMYLVDPVDEYCVQNLPEFEGKKFQNVAKEGLQFGDEGEREKEKLEELQENFKPLTTWLKDTALKDIIDKAVVSNRLTDSPCALVASQYGWYVGGCTRVIVVEQCSNVLLCSVLLVKVELTWTIH